MKITSFNPIISTKNPDELVALFEALGFEIRHDNTEPEDREGIRMKNENGFCVDVVKSPLVVDRDSMSIRMNVDDFDEAHELLLSRGFKDAGSGVFDTKTAISVGMVSPSGFVIGLVHHKKK